MFELKEQRFIRQTGADARLYRHSCGMEVLCLQTADPENMFSVCFPTVPGDDTGVAHILEHTVLSGSRRFPVKDPFMEMIKGSMATFINAVTYQDHTVYPVASAVPRDFFNLAAVYFDAIFNPLLTESAFSREGWHLEYENPENKSRLKFNGIVYNEMTAALCDTDEVIAREIYTALLGGTPRRFISGGHPDCITNLKYGDFLRFYRSHYRPSNARVFFYGNIPAEEKLAFLEEALKTADTSLPPLPMMPRRRQHRWTAPHTKTAFCQPDEARGDDKCCWAMACMLSDEWEPVTDMAFEFADYLLLGNAASPLKKAILESGLCESMAISGYDNETPETCFIVAVTGIDSRDFLKMRHLVDKVLRDTVNCGFTREQLDTAFLQFKMEQSEITSDYVYSQMEKVFDSWCYGKSPFLFLDNSAVLEQLQQKIEQNPGWITELIGKFILENPHKLYLKLLPDSGFMKSRKAELRRKLAQAAANGKVHNDCPEEENTPEALATLPRLSLADVPPEPVALRTSLETLPNGVDFITVDEPSNGVVYLDMAFPVQSMDYEELLRLSQFAMLYPSVGTAEAGYDTTAARWASAAASNTFATISGMDREGHSRLYISVRFKALADKLPYALSLLRERLSSSVFTERERIASLAGQIWSQNCDDLEYYSSYYCGLRGAYGLSPLSGLREEWQGIRGLSRNRYLAGKFSKEYPGLAAKLGCIMQKLSELTPCAAAFQGPDSARKLVADFLCDFSCPGKSSRAELPDFSPERRYARAEGLVINSDVSAAARVLPAPGFWEDDSIPLAVLANVLSCGMLWDEVRIKGGAYGTSAAYNNMFGTFTLSSSQDPEPRSTLAVFDRIAKTAVNLGEQELTNGIISTIKSYHAPIRPDKAAPSALFNHLFGIGQEVARERQDRYLALKLSHIRAAAERLWNGKGNDCVIGPKNKLSFLDRESILNL